MWTKMPWSSFPLLNTSIKMGIINSLSSEFILGVMKVYC